MKLFLSVIAFFLVIGATAQTGSYNNLQVNSNLRLHGHTVNDVSDDSTFSSQSHTALPTEWAVWNFMNNRMGGVFQPLENQRLSTTDNVDFYSVNSKTGISVGDGTGAKQQGIFVNQGTTTVDGGFYLPNHYLDTLISDADSNRVFVTPYQNSLKLNFTDTNSIIATKNDLTFKEPLHKVSVVPVSGGSVVVSYNNFYEISPVGGPINRDLTFNFPNYSVGNTVPDGAFIDLSTTDAVDSLIIKWMGSHRTDSVFYLKKGSYGTFRYSAADSTWYGGFGIDNATGVGGTSVLDSTAQSGMLKGSGNHIVSAMAGTDYLTPTGSGAGLTGITESQVTNLTTDLAGKLSLTGGTLTDNTTGFANIGFVKFLSTSNTSGGGISLSNGTQEWVPLTLGSAYGADAGKFILINKTGSKFPLVVSTDDHISIHNSTVVGTGNDYLTVNGNIVAQAGSFKSNLVGISGNYARDIADLYSSDNSTSLLSFGGYGHSGTTLTYGYISLAASNPFFNPNVVIRGNNVGFGNDTLPTARLQLPAGTSISGTASLKVLPGVKLTTPESGAIESDTTGGVYSLMWTNKILTRRSFAFLDGGTYTGSITAPSFIKSGGTSSQFLMADGSILSSIPFAALPADTTHYLDALHAVVHTSTNRDVVVDTLSSIKNGIVLAGGVLADHSDTIAMKSQVRTLIPQYQNSILKTYQYLGSNAKAMTLGSNGPMNGSAALTNQILLLTLVHLDNDATLTGVQVQMNSAPSYTGNNYNGVGLYSVNPNGTYTLVASSTNSGTIWGTSNFITLSIPFSSTYAATAGVYAVGLLYCESAQTTAPAFWNGLNMGSSIIGSGFGNGISVCATLTAQTSLPSTLTASSLTKYNIAPFVVVY